MERNNKEYPNHLVTDEILLEELVEAGYLLNLCRVAPSKYDETKRVWFFDKVDGIKQIIDDYYASKRAAKEYDKSMK